MKKVSFFLLCCATLYASQRYNLTVKVKDLRNDIAHEYIDDALQDLFEDIMRLTPHLIKIAKSTLKYTEQYQQ